jgi:putative transposase
MTTRRRKSLKQIVRLLGQADRLLANGQDLAGACRGLRMLESGFCRWPEPYGGMDVDDAKRPKELEEGNATLKPRQADAGVEKLALKDIARAKVEGPRAKRALSKPAEL